MSTHMTKAAEARWRESWAELNGDATAFDAHWTKKLCLSLSTIRGRRSMLGLRAKKKPRPPMWTDAIDLELLEAWAAWEGPAFTFARHWAKGRVMSASSVNGRRQILLRAKGAE